VICPDCGRKPVQEGRDTCFRCRVITQGTIWRGGGFLYGRDNFSTRTNREFIAEHVGDTAGKAHLGSKESL